MIKEAGRQRALQLFPTAHALLARKKDHGRAEASVRRNSKQERERELADQAKLTRAWRQWHREQLEEALRGLHRGVLEQMTAELEDLRSARALVDFVAAQNWAAIDSDARAVALHEINRTITEVRERMNRNEPISDALPHEPLRAFQLIRKVISDQFPATSRKANPGGRARVDRRKCHE